MITLLARYSLNAVVRTFGFWVKSTDTTSFADVARAETIGLLLHGEGQFEASRSLGKAG